MDRTERLLRLIFSLVNASELVPVATIRGWFPADYDAVSDEAFERIFAEGGRLSKQRESDLSDLMTYGPFPEPLLGQDQRRTRIWRRTREELLIREDLRDLSRLPERSRIEMLTALLPAKVGGLLSVQSLSEGFEVTSQSEIGRGGCRCAGVDCAS